MPNTQHACISQRHFGRSNTHPGPLHTTFICEIWHNGADHFLVFYLCVDFLTIIDPLHNFTTPTTTMTNNLATTLATTFLHHNLPALSTPSFRSLNRLVIQNDVLHATTWLCGTIAILRTFHLALGQIRRVKIHGDNIRKRHVLTSHQSLLP
jgi:hypothetical protein